jgi:hypothetical protein
VKPDSPVHYYVYYRIAAPHAAAARAVIEAVLRALEDRAGIVGRLLQRVDEPLLWMEVYENVRNPERFEATLGDLLRARRFTAFLAPVRAQVAGFIAPSPRRGEKPLHALSSKESLPCVRPGRADAHPRFALIGPTATTHPAPPRWRTGGGRHARRSRSRAGLGRRGARARWALVTNS